ncbi:energy transducer TonB [Parapedobacter pyrenivorans]|uniref:energy transducer TonB n=1 Tax=Parapedobacter pyrenivorans TaxID=1305674 RepID=UPI0033402412
MFHPKQDIFSQSWLDVIFEGRNKQYGAYVLRKDASKNASVALFVASTVFVIALLVPLIKNRLFPVTDSHAILDPFERERIIELAPPPPVDRSLPLPAIALPSTPRTSRVRMPPPEVVKASQATEEPPSVAALKLAEPASQTLTGNPGATIHIDRPVGHGHGEAVITETTGQRDEPFITVEIEPMFPGGMQAFFDYVQKNYRYPAGAIANGVKGKIILTFIVERDGSLTDIKIVRDLKFGTGEEAIRLLKSAPKWNPGIQNGREVRVAYTLPIGLDISR